MAIQPRTVKCVALVVGMLVVAGCNSWDGRSQVRLHDGKVFACTGIAMRVGTIVCYQHSGSGIAFPWDKVAGYATGSEAR